jgi:DNA polymerase I-like protein with 3'-5' exonuclease and polymerase domains
MIHKESDITRFSNELPCPVCGGHPGEPRGNGIRCFGFLSEGGIFANCTREEFAGELKQNENSNTYSHLLSGQCRCGERHDEGFSDNGHKKIVATYEYTDPRGNPVHRTVRFDPKDFRQQRFEDGVWEWGLKGKDRVLYRLPEVLNAVLKGEKTLICEGEKDVQAARRIGFTATTCAEGAKKWRESYNYVFRGADVVLVPHNDPSGRAHMKMVGESILHLTNTLKMLILPGVPEDGGDLHDWVAAGGTKEDLERLIEEAEFVSSETIGNDISDETNLPFKTGREIAEATPVITEWIAYPWFPKGTIVEVSGKIKLAGKTTWLAHACAKILNGADFLGGHTRKTKVIFLTEQSPNSFRKVLRHARLERDDIKVLYWHEVRGVDWESLIAAVGKEAKAFGALVIVIDVISRWASFAGVSESDASYADKTVPPLKELASEGFTIIYARHDRKSGGDVGESGRGTSQLGGDVDQMFQLSRPPGSNNAPNVRVLTNTGRFTEDTPASVNIELKNGEFRSIGSAKNFARENALKVIPEVLPATEEAAIESSEVVDRVSPHGVRRSACYEALNDLSEAGVIVCVGSGKKGDPQRYYRPVEGEEKDLNKNSSETPIPRDISRTNTKVVQNRAQLNEMVSTLSPAPEVGFDVETYPQDKTARSLDPRRGKIAVITLSTKDLTYVIDRKAFRDPPDTEELLDALRSVLSGKPMVAHNAPFDLAFLRRDVGYEHDGPVYDTLVLDAMLFYATGPLAQKDSWRGFVAKDKEQGHKKKLSEVAATRLGVTLDKTEQSSDWGGELSLAMVSYAAEDAAVLLPLKDVLITELENLGMGKIVELEAWFTPSMTYCSDNGFAIDVEGWKEHARDAQTALEGAKVECDRLAPEPPEGEAGWEWSWNASNHRKVGKALELLGAKVEKNPKTGYYKTDEAALKDIKRPKEAKELAESILVYRAHEKYVTTYGEGWFREPETVRRGKTKGKVKGGSPDHLQIIEGRVHTKLNQLVATGRGSSKSPNLQNLPKDLRKYFVAPPGRKLVVADYSQMEYVAAAYMAGDQALLEPIRRGEDYHDATAKMIGVDRSVAKMVNFALLYGMSAKSLAGRLGISKEEAQGHIDAIRSRAPALRVWCEEQSLNAANGTPYAKTPLGRVRLVDQNYRRYNERWESNRSQMLNHPVQGGCADGYKLAAAMVWERKDEFSGRPLLVNMVHDELVLEVDEDTAPTDAELLEEIMKEGMRIAIGKEIPVRADTEIKNSWG